MTVSSHVTDHSAKSYRSLRQGLSLGAITTIVTTARKSHPLSLGVTMTTTQVYSLDTAPLWFSVFNFVQDSSIQSKDYTSFSTPRDITSFYQTCYHTLVLLHRSTNRASTLTLSYLAHSSPRTNLLGHLRTTFTCILIWRQPGLTCLIFKDKSVARHYSALQPGARFRLPSDFWPL